MGKKRYKMKKLPPANKYLNTTLLDENTILWDKIYIQQNNFSSICRTIAQRKTINRENCINYALSIFELIQVGFNTLYLLEKYYGGHFHFTVDEIIKWGTKKNEKKI